MRTIVWFDAATFGPAMRSQASIVKSPAKFQAAWFPTLTYCVPPRPP
ncbi:MAG: hypothetical protein HY075_00300 [Deltaproteobacteria bacterium]|nr:hypothetical protein [Deltaproteobacteria bacterium]